MKKQIVKILLLLLFSTGWFQSSAQYGLRLSYIKHSGYMGYLVKPTISYELTLAHMESDNGRFKANGVIGYMNLKTWHDTVPHGTFSYGGTPTLLPSYYVYHDISEFIFGLNFDYSILDNNLTPTVGIDVYMNLIEYDYDHFVPGVISKSATNEHAGTFSILPRIGVIYDADDRFLFRSGIGKNIGVDHNFNSMYFWKIFVEAVYFF